MQTPFYRSNSALENHRVPSQKCHMSQVGMRELTRAKNERVHIEASCNAVAQARDSMASAENSRNAVLIKCKCLTKGTSD